MRHRGHPNFWTILLAGIAFLSCRLCPGQTLSSETNFSPEVSAFFRNQQQIFGSNLTWYSQLKSTNPALAEVVSEQRILKEHLLALNAHHAIIYLQDFGLVYPTHTEFWHYSFEKAGQRLWTIQTGLYGRCMLQMNVPFEVDSTQTNILKWEAPTLLLITYADPAPGRKDFSRGYGELSRQTLTTSDWTNVVRAGGALSVHGYTGPTNRYGGVVRAVSG